MIKMMNVIKVDIHIYLQRLIGSMKLGFLIQLSLSVSGLLGHPLPSDESHATCTEGDSILRLQVDKNS